MVSTPTTLGLRVLRVLRVEQGLKAPRALLDHKVNRAPRVSKARRVWKAFKEHLALLVLLVLPALRAHKVLLE